MTTHKHGESRNHRVESTQGQYSSHEFSVCERYCEKCDSWGTVKGLVTSDFCPTCEIPFDKFWWDESDKHKH